MEFILEQQANVAVQEAKFYEGLQRLDRRLDRAVKLAVREARNERKRRQELDAKLTASQARVDEEFAKLAEAQRATEATLKAFIASLRGGGNGKPGNGAN
jgi:hypothetical protein